MNTVCILCRGSDPKKVETLDYGLLKRLYSSGLSIDLEIAVDRKVDTDHIDLLECQNCKLRFFAPLITGNSEFYRLLAKNPWYYGAEKWEFTEASQMLRTAKTKAVLEIGCGSGQFLKMLAPEIDRVGLEFTPSAAEAARKTGAEVHEKSIESFSQDPANRGRFDFVCSFQVLEHVPNPHDFLRAAVDCLRPGGRLFLSVPNSEGFPRYATNNILDMPPHHVSRWSVETMNRAADLFGLRMVSHSFEPIATYHREWYRTTALTLKLSKAVGNRVPPLTDTTRFAGRLKGAIIRKVSNLVPDSFWDYRRFSGHTFFVELLKP